MSKMNLFLSIDFSHSYVIVERLFPCYLNVCVFSFVALWHGEVTSVSCMCVSPPPLTQPLIMMPTACWKLDWEELETNSDNFYALCQLLREKVSRSVWGLLLLVM